MAGEKYEQESKKQKRKKGKREEKREKRRKIPEQKYDSRKRGEQTKTYIHP